MGVIGSLALLAGIAYFWYVSESLALSVLFTIGSISLLYLCIKMALRRVKKGKRESSFYNDSHQEGYVSAQFDTDAIGKEGIADTDLGPSGFIIVAGRRLQALAKSEYIEKGSPIHVISGQGAYLIVKRSNKDTLQ